MIRTRKLICTVGVAGTIAITNIFATPALASGMVLNTDVNTAREDCVFLGIEGSYYAQADAALDRINEIRKEACEEGVISPSTGKPLKTSDYVPIKWSSDLEYIARIRAAEASLTMGHIRTNGDSCFAIDSPNGEGSYGEVVAWNNGKNIVAGINQWYDEKQDWVKKTGRVTGHYTQMIDPDHTYVGLGMFCSDVGKYFNTTVGEFSYSEDLDSTYGVDNKNCIQTLEMAKEYLIDKYKISGKKELTGGHTEKLQLLVSVDLPGFVGEDGLYGKDATWTSSDQEICGLEIEDPYTCKVTANTCGTATISAVYEGKTVKKTIVVAHDWSQWKETIEPTVFSTGKKVRTCSVCEETEEKEIAKIKPTVKLSCKNKTLKVKKYFTLKISGLATGDAVAAVKASNKNVKVSKASANKYKVTGKKRGKAQVTVTLKSAQKAICKVTVK